MSKSIKRIPVIGWFGVALLAFSFGGALWVLRSQAGEDVNSPPPQSGMKKVAGSYGYIDVEGNVAKLYPLQPGRVLKIAVHDNDVVEKDTPLLLLDDTVAKADLARAQAAVAAAELDLQKAKLLPAVQAEKITGQKAALAAKQSQLEAAQKKRDFAKRIFDKKEGGVSQEDLDSAEAMVRSLQEAVKGEEALLRALEKDNPALDIQRAEQQIKEKQALVKQAEFALRECTLRAPYKGTVLRVAVAEGDVFGPNPKEPAVMFCREGPRIIRAEVDQEFGNRLFLNQTALIRDDSTNSAVLHGKVTRISDWYSHRRSMVQEPLQFNDVRTLECLITLDTDEKTPPLRIGQRVRVTLEATK